VAWWKNREENDRTWKVSVNDVLKHDESGNLVSANLDIKNPKGKQDFEHLPPEQLADDIMKKERRIAEIMAEIKQTLAMAE
jgi:type I restriction enzyme M protein